MTKIAEAWERVGETLGAYGNHCVDHARASVIDADFVDMAAAIRDLALAVLDEAEREASEHVRDFLDTHELGFADWTLHLEALREEINKLGEKAND